MLTNDVSDVDGIPLTSRSVSYSYSFRWGSGMKKFIGWVAAAALFMGSVAHADLDTALLIDVDGTGLSAVTGDMTGVNEVTLWNNAAAGDDLWNEGDTFTYLHDSEKKSGDFTATVRVVGQTASIDGRWGKGGLMMRNSLESNSANAMPAVYTGNGSQITPPSTALGNNILDHSPVPHRVNGRTVEGNNDGGFERIMFDALGQEIQNNFAPTAAPGTVDAPVNPAWLRLHYQAPTAEAPNGTIIGAYAADDNGAPGDWAFSEPITDVDIAEDGAWYVGLGYSVHNSMSSTEQVAVPGPDGGANPNGLHGLRFDSYEFTPEYIEPVKTFRVAGNSIGGLAVKGALSNLQLGDVTTEPGLGTYWYDRNMTHASIAISADGGYLQTAGYLENADGNTELDEGLFGRVVNPVGWHMGSGGPRTINGVEYPKYPEGTFADSDRDNYGMIARGQIWVPENGTYAIADGVDDFTMVAVDLNGEDGIEGIADLFDSDVADPDALLFGNEVAILDGDWSNFDLGGGPGDRTEPRIGNNYNDNLEFTGVAAGGEWRDIEIWMAEGGGGDGGPIYFGKADEFVWSEERQSATTTDADGVVNITPEALTAEERDMFIVGPDQLQTTGQAVIGGDSMAELADGFNYIMQVSGSGSDQITVEDANGLYTTTLDVSKATIDIVDGGGLANGAEIQLFGADNITGTPTLNFVNPDDWDLSKLAQGIIVFGGVGDPCNPNTSGDLDGNGKVEFADFLVLSGNFGKEVAGHADGDIDCNGKVEFADFLTLSGNFGREVGGAQSVPEPSSFLLFGLAGLMGGLLRRRRS